MQQFFERCPGSAKAQMLNLSTASTRLLTVQLRKELGSYACFPSCTVNRSHFLSLTVYRIS
jgi:hypothetical protein